MIVRRGTTCYWITVLCIAVLFQLPCCWAGEEESERFYTEGLIPFREGEEAFLKALKEGDERYRQEGKVQFEKALALFQQAAAEKPSYYLAVYYLGVTYGKLGRYAEAVPPLQETRERRPKLIQVQQDLAVAYYHLGRYQEALALLDRVVVENPQNYLVHYYKGLSHAGLKDNSAAIFSLKRAAEIESPIRPYAYYYLALTHLAKGESENAARAFQLAADSAPPNSALKRKYLLALNKNVLAQRDFQKTEKPWEIRLGISSGYDSNVVLAPDENPVPSQISDKSALFITASLGGSLNLWQTREAYLTGGYDFYQSLYRDLDDYNVQSHKLRLRGGWSPSPSYNLGLEAGTNYYRVGGDNYLLEPYVMPSLGFFIKPWMYTQLVYRWAKEDYRVSYFDPARDGYRHEISVRQYFLLNGFERYVFLGYQYDNEDPSNPAGDDFAYKGNLVEVGMRTPGPWETSVDLSYSFHDEHYEYPNSRSIPPFSKKRNDDIHRVSLTVWKNLTPSLEVYASYRGTIDNSNIDVFEYDRHIGSIGLRLVY